MVCIRETSGYFAVSSEHYSYLHPDSLTVTESCPSRARSIQCAAWVSTSGFWSTKQRVDQKGEYPWIIHFHRWHTRASTSTSRPHSLCLMKTARRMSSGNRRIAERSGGTRIRCDILQSYMSYEIVNRKNTEFAHSMFSSRPPCDVRPTCHATPSSERPVTEARKASKLLTRFQQLYLIERWTLSF